jgi:hypothetical protein
MCKEPVRVLRPGEMVKTNTYMLEGALTITAHTHGGTSETRRYCPRCTPVVKDALMELGFDFSPASDDSSSCGCPFESAPGGGQVHIATCPLGVDYARLEQRAVAALADADLEADDFLGGRDGFAELARSLTGRDPVTHPPRSRCTCDRFHLAWVNRTDGVEPSPHQFGCPQRVQSGDL